MTNTDASQIAADLAAAAEYIEAHGWIQHRTGSPGGPVCAAGALRAVASAPAWEPQTVGQYERYSDSWGAASDYLGQSLAGWNDNPTRTREEVVAALRAASEAVAS